MLNPRPSSAFRAGRVVALLVVAALAAAACVPGAGGQASPTPTLAPTPTPSANPFDGVAEGDGAGVKLGYLSYGDLVPFVLEISNGIRAQAQLAGAELVECDARLDPNRVSSCMKQLTEAGVKGIIQFQGTLADPAVVCTETPAGLPVLAVEFAQDPCAGTLVSADDLRAGQIAGRAVGEWVKERWSCTYDAYISFESVAAATKSRLRMEGYQQGFSAVCPITNLQVGRSVDTESTAKAAMTGVLATLAGKSKIVVVAVNGDAARGALEAAKAAGREGDVWVSGQGGEEPSRELIRTNEHYLGDAAYFPERYGRTIVPAILDLVAGKTVQPLLLIEPAWLDASTIDAIYPK
ncbi:MAG TPA: sugar ABC transporter substrate-binding protein [Candidatus Nanopelagicales bacterium]|nr:sugar ABC transporter substrate-binding protein [Candidatus Nanopelagicales bacterium]